MTAPAAWARESVNGRGLGRPAFGRARREAFSPDASSSPAASREIREIPEARPASPPPEDASSTQRTVSPEPTPERAAAPPSPASPPEGPTDRPWTDAEVRRLKLVVAEAYQAGVNHLDTSERPVENFGEIPVSAEYVRVAAAA